MVAQQAASYLGNKLNTVVKVDKVDISFFKFVRFEEVYIEDLNQDTLAYIQSLSAEIEDYNFKNDSVSIDLGLVQIEHPVYKLHQPVGDSVTNLAFILDSLISADTNTSGSNVFITASNLIVTNGYFIWDNDNIEPLPFGVDWDHIGLSEINADLTNFKMVNDSFIASIDMVNWSDKSGFVLDHFSGDAIFSSTTTLVNNLKIKTPYSDLKLDLNYKYDSIASYTEFIDDVYMRYTLDTSIISFKDIAYFAPELEGMDYSVKVFGKERGPVSDMKFQDIYLEYGQATVVYGRIFINGLPEIESTSFTCNLKKVSSNYADLKTIKTYPFTSGEIIPIPKFINNAGLLSFKGNFTGFYNDFVTYGTFNSNNGSLNTDLQLAQQDSATIHYKGQVKSTNFDLAQISNKPGLLGKASIDITVEGENFDFETMDLEVKGQASRFDFMGYSYNDIKVDMVIKDQAIFGLLDVVDTNLNLAFDGKISLKGDIPRYEFVSTINHLRPKQLHLLERDSSATLSTEVIFNFQGNSLDNIIGRAGLRNFEFTEYEETVVLEQVDFLGFTTGKDKTLSLTSDNINMQITGEFYFKELVKSLNHVIYKWLPSIYEKPQLKPESVENFHLVMDAKKFSGFSSIFIPQVTFTKDLNIDLSFNSELEKIEVLVKSSKMNLGGQNVEDLDLNAKLTADTFSLNSSLSSILFTDSNYIENFNISAKASENLIKSNIDWNNFGEEVENSGDLFFELKFQDPENFKIDFMNSSLVINDTLWQLHDSSEIIKNHKEYAFNNVALTQNYQDFKLDGYISEDPEKELIIEVDSFNLRFLNPVFKKFNIQTTGMVDGTTILKDVYNDFRLYSNSSFQDLNFNNQFIGDGHIKSEWDANKEKFDVDINFYNKEYETVKLFGSYYPKKRKEKLDLKLSLNQFPVKIIEPFFLDYIDNIEGTISGSASLKGTFNEPLLQGDFTLNNVVTRVIYLNEKLYVNNQNVFIRPNLIGADLVTIEDSRKKKAQVNFSLFHNNYEDVNFDLAITSIDVFRAFNTKKTDNEFFYGKVYLNPGSTVGMESDYEGNLNLNANIISGPGTSVVIPFYEDDEVALKEYIYFKDVSNKTEVINEEELNHEESVGLNLDMSMDLNKNAEVQLIFDEFTNDKIQATGEGIITLKINDEGDFSIFGNYEISEGFYLFTFSKVISKKFNINPGSRITWNGDPYEGKADINAAYKVRTTLYELGITATYDSTELTKRVPVDVVLNMSGNYMNPELAFSFILPAKYDEISTLLNNLDEGEKNKQVFSLLILNKFMPVIGGDVSSGSNIAATNSTEVLSNQLSSWLSKIDNDIDIGVRYNPGDDKITANEIEFALSTQILNDRILLETNLGISGDVNSTTSTKTNNIVGEGTLSYKVNKKGNIVAKVFNRSNDLNPAYSNIDPYTQGIGIAYTEPFKNGKNLGCILSNHFKKVDDKRNCEEEYYEQQEEESEETLAKIHKKVAKSRIKQEKRKKREEERLAKVALKGKD